MTDFGEVFHETPVEPAWPRKDLTSFTEVGGGNLAIMSTFALSTTMLLPETVKHPDPILIIR